MTWKHQNSEIAISEDDLYRYIGYLFRSMETAETYTSRFMAHPQAHGPPAHAIGRRAPAAAADRLAGGGLPRAPAAVQGLARAASCR